MPSKVLVTGASGFLGQHVVSELRSRGIDPIVKRRDLLEFEGVIDFFLSECPNIVIHLAASVGGIGANQRYPATFFRDNMLMGMNVIEACRFAFVQKLLVVGTVCSYPRLCPVPFREQSLWDGYPEETNAPYGIAKKALLVMMQAYRVEHGLNSIMVMPTNLYGPGDDFAPNFAHVIPEMIRKFETARTYGEQSVTLWGDGSPTRDFLYVKDAARGICDALELYESPDPVNLGTGIEIRIDSLAGLVKNVTGYSGDIAWDVTRPNGQPRRLLDTKRASVAFGFSPTVSLADGLDETVAWYRKNRR
jgi:GDP-L-fucose synthase